MKKTTLLIGIVSLISIAGCSTYKTTPVVPTTTSTTTTTTETTTPAPTPCPAMPTVDSCPANQEKYVVFSSPDCGEYYGCRATTPAPTPKPNPVTLKNVSIVNFSFSSLSTEISAGGTIRWTNNDSAPHSIVADDGSFQSTTLQQGETFSFTFKQAGVYTYHCGIHASMKGTIVVK